MLPLFVLAGLLFIVPMSHAQDTDVSDMLSGLDARLEEHRPDIKGLIQQTLDDPTWRAQFDTLKEGTDALLGVKTEPGLSTDTRSSPRIYIFISSSMPFALTREYVRQASFYDNVFLVLRGFVGGATKTLPTVRFLHKALLVDETCTGEGCALYAVPIHIDPLVFRRFQIRRVPAFAVEQNPYKHGYCQIPQDQAVSATNAPVVYGNVNLSYALENL